MQMTRFGLFHISFEIGVEGRKKQRANPGQLIGSMPVCDLDDGQR